MSCFVPEQYRNLRWHILRPNVPWRDMPTPYFEIAEWINNEDNGPTEKGHWVRWGYCGDFPSLCQANYIGPFPDQEMLERAA